MTVSDSLCVFSAQLLLFICGSKEKYRQLRDEHAVDSHLAQVREIGEQGGWDQTLDLAPHSIVLPYDTLLTLVRFRTRESGEDMIRLWTGPHKASLCPATLCLPR